LIYQQGIDKSWFVFASGNALDKGDRGEGIIMKIDRAKKKIADYLRRSGFRAI
jgi:hypothetical protein